MLAGLAMMGILHNNWSIANMLSASGFVQQSPRYLPIMLLVVIGAFSKSAIVPFHFWLPNAMEAPTPVSAFLHSATMVKAGIYLLARMNPILGGTPAWQTILIVAGGATLLTGAILALRHTDMKQMLAYSTIGMLGLLTMLIGAGSTAAITAMIVLLVAHAFYKGALFLVVGTIEHQAGSRDITHVSGLFRAMPISGIAAILGAASMAGVPIAIGYYGKEELYTLIAGGNLLDPAVVLVAVIGNALMLAVGLAIALRAFFGSPPQTPIVPREGSPSLLLGGAILSVAGIAAGYYIHEFGLLFVMPMLASIAGGVSAVDLQAWHFVPVLLALSVITWGLGGLVFWFLNDIRTMLRRIAQVWSWGPDQGFDQAMVGLIRFSARITNSIHHGRLEGYLALIFGTLAAVTLVPLLIAGFPSLPPIPELAPHEWGIMALAVVGLVAVVLARTRLTAIVSLGIQGLAVAIIFLIYGAPDLSFTQFMIEVLSVVILALVMTRLNVDLRNRRLFENVVRDGAIAVLAGAGLTALLVVVLSLPLDQRLAEFFTAHSVVHGHGRNIVNVILVDFRALDTLGEITVVMAAGIAVFALIASAGSSGRTAPQPTVPKKAVPKSGARAGRPLPRLGRARNEHGHLPHACAVPRLANAVLFVVRAVAGAQRSRRRVHRRPDRRFGDGHLFARCGRGGGAARTALASARHRRLRRLHRRVHPPAFNTCCGKLRLQ